MTKRPSIPFNVPALVSKSPFYAKPFEFKSSASGGITLFVSNLAKDWPQFQFQAQAEVYAKTWIAYSRLWLERHGWSPVRIQIVRGYTQPGNFDFNDQQAELRRLITSDFLAPENAGKPISDWRGLSQPVQRGLIDYGVKK
jgi:hypothetical protein